MCLKDKLYQKLATEFLRTHRLVRIFADEDLQLQPVPESMSVAQLVAHIVASRHFLQAVFSEKVPKVEHFKVLVDQRSAVALRRELLSVHRAVLEACLKAQESFLEEEVAPFGPDWQMSRWDMGQLMLEHEIHHRGQLSVYARLAGKVPPELYAPVSEEILEESPRG